MIMNLFPIPNSDQLTLAMSPGVLFRPYLGTPVPNAELIEKTIQTTPYQIANLGVIPNTSSVNHNTLNYFGALRNFQVYGRELGNTPETVAEDSQNFDWFITQTGDNGFAREPQLAFAKTLASDSSFQLIKNWSLPDKNILELYHRNNPSVAVLPLNKRLDNIHLDLVSVADKIAGERPVSINYQWSGSWEKLTSGLVLLTWRSRTNPDAFWIHDHYGSKIYDYLG